ncbi:DUF3299 domain-containing protein [Shimia sp. MIT1388]|uniref:DUF3299 domain-containing protein n=1 Tax=Shimia sp. MIT1388 TaxID=3096992 RepID=UPI00399AF1C6
MKALLLSAALTLTASLGLAEQAKDIEWADLEGPSSAFENPFENLTDLQMQTLARILRLDYLAETETDANAKEDATGLRAELAGEGIDADFLLAERLRIMTKLENESRMPNDAIVGQTVRMPGYLLPLELDGNLAVEFLLVPTVGACIHTPPPPANQIVHVRYPAGYPTETLFAPVWITGELRSEFDSHSLYMVDGEADVDVTYTMDADSVIAYGS